MLPFYRAIPLVFPVSLNAAFCYLNIYSDIFEHLCHAYYTRFDGLLCLSISGLRGLPVVVWAVYV